MAQTYLLLGTNLGNRADNLAQACDWIGQRLGKIVVQSSIYETMPWGKTDQPEFYNQVLGVETHLAPEALLVAALEIEALMGRLRQEHWGERVIDIDVLYYDDLIWESAQLSVPHPAIAARRFTLIPLVEIAPEYIHPVLGQSNQALLERCLDPLGVQKLASLVCSTPEQRLL